MLGGGSWATVLRVGYRRIPAGSNCHKSNDQRLLEAI